MSSQMPMNKFLFALSGVCRAFLNNWRPFVLGLLIVFTAATSCVLYFHGSERAERAAVAIGGTLIGMLVVSFFVCRR